MMEQLFKRHPVVANSLFAVTYLLLALLGQTQAIEPGNVTPVWLPSGIVLFVVLMYGKLFLPGIFFGAFLGNAWAYLSWDNLLPGLFSGLINGVADTVCALVGVALYKRFVNFKKGFTQCYEIPLFVLFISLVPGFISAVIGVGGLALTGFIKWQQYSNTLFTWWIGDSTGILFITPFLFYLKEWKDWSWMTMKKSVELNLYTWLFFFCNFIAVGFFNISKMGAAILVISWLYSLVRFPYHITHFFMLISTVFIIVITVHGFGPFKSSDTFYSLLLSQFSLSLSFISVMIFYCKLSNRREDKIVIPEN